jgi:general secretion pathway protein C
MANPLITQLNNPAVLLQINQRLAMVASVLLIVACAYVLVQITWLFFPQEEEQQQNVQRKSVPVSRAQPQQDNFRNLTSANIFGVSETVAVKQQAKAPETRLDLSLKGVLAAKPMTQASAIIAQGKSGKEDIYGIGDKIQGGVSVKEIYSEYVVLERNGQEEILKLQKITGLEDVEAGFKAEPEETPDKSPGSELKDIRDNLIKDPVSFGDYALPVVVKENGKQVGYRLQPQEKGELLSSLGIQSDDVITQINGIRLDQPQNGIKALRNLRNARIVNLVVKRNGADVPINITLQ